MHGGEAKKLLGFPPNSHPTLSQVKVAYKQKAWETHPDRFPALQKSMAESNFKPKIFFPSASLLCKSGENWRSKRHWQKPSFLGQGAISGSDDGNGFTWWCSCCKDIPETKEGISLTAPISSLISKQQLLAFAKQGLT